VLLNINYKDWTEIKSVTQTIKNLQNHGYAIIPNFVTSSYCKEILKTGVNALEQRIPPFELEAELAYPGAPKNLNSLGGQTIRRLRKINKIDPVLFNWVLETQLIALIEEYFGSNVSILANHHNSLMTKHPLYGTATDWHQDIRYWNYQQDDLITAWLALGNETPENGGMHVISGSHKMQFTEKNFDSLQFFKDPTENKIEITSQEQPIILNQGDLLLFHCKTLHRAGRNNTDDIKFSLVYTFKKSSNQPIQNTRSAQQPESIPLTVQNT